MSSSAYALREIPLSTAPRQSRRAPLFDVIKGAIYYYGDFEQDYGYVVNLHGQGSYDAAKDLVDNCLADADLLYLEREHDNEHDENAVKVYYNNLSGTAVSSDFLGYLDRETAARVAPELDKGARLVATPQGRPFSGSGGRLEILITLGS